MTHHPKKSNYVYGRSPNPSSWHETADILKQSQHKTKKPSPINEAIQKLLKEHK